MSKLTVESKPVGNLFQDKKADFLIPDYQRPYAWGEEECQTLWDDIFAFAIPDDDAKAFDPSSEYFLGPIVTFSNKKGQMEIIDGQQRLTTLMLLLRAFYSKFGHMKDDDSIFTKGNIEKCLWKTNEFGKPDPDKLKIDSEVASDNDKEEFLTILRTGTVEKDQKSSYANNYRFFQKCIDKLLDEYPSYFALLPTRIMNNCILLPIEADTRDTALQIFSTLNDRGMPLSDSDIFKAQFYSYYSSLNKKDDFVKRWKALEELCGEIFHPQQGSPMDEIFTRYMYYVRAKRGIKSSTTLALRTFYEDDSYAILKDEDTFEDLVTLADFWNDVSNQDEDRFSASTLRKLFVLNYAPNSMWTYMVSVYFMQNHKDDGSLDEESFTKFLDKITGFIWAYSFTNPGLSSLRAPAYTEMVNIVNDQPVSFSDYKFDVEQIRGTFDNYNFTNTRPITRSMLTWWAFTDDKQKLLSLETVLEIEHIYARNRQDKEKSLKNPKNLESIGNKVLLEKRINIRAADYRFVDKKKYYKGYTNGRGQVKEGTNIYELQYLADNYDDFNEEDIIKRTTKIRDNFEASGMIVDKQPGL